MGADYNALFKHMMQLRIYTHLLAKCGVRHIKVYRLPLEESE